MSSHRGEFLQRRSLALLTNEELKRLWTLLDSHAEPANGDAVGSAQETEQMIGFKNYEVRAGRRQ